MKIFVFFPDTHDPTVITATTDPERAKKLEEILSDRGDVWVEEVNSENCNDLLEGRVPFAVMFDSLGRVMRGYPDNRARKREFFKPGVFAATLKSLVVEPERILVNCYAPNSHKAVRIAAEMRAKFIEEREAKR